MSNPGDRALASVAGNVEKLIQAESETVRPRSRSEALTETIGGFIGTGGQGA
jgi:hypothetical protein